MLPGGGHTGGEQRCQIGSFRRWRSILRRCQGAGVLCSRRPPWPSDQPGCKLFAVQESECCSVLPAEDQLLPVLPLVDDRESVGGAVIVGERVPRPLVPGGQVIGHARSGPRRLRGTQLSLI